MNYLDEVKEKLKPYPADKEQEVESFLSALGFARLGNDAVLSDFAISVIKRRIMGEITKDEATDIIIKDIMENE